jgi:hypothetical protein
MTGHQEAGKIGIGVPVFCKEGKIDEVDGAAAVEVGTVTVVRGAIEQPVSGNYTEVFPVDVVIIIEIALVSGNGIGRAGQSE